MLLIPSMDLRGGHCVRLLKGDFAAETRYALRPEALVDRYLSFGASWVHVVDLDGARDGRLANRATIVALARTAGREGNASGETGATLRLQVGGGVRSADAIADLLDQGVARVVIGSAAIEEPARAREWLRQFGPERLCLAFDVHLEADGTPRVRTRGWTRESALSLWEAVALYTDAGLRHVLCTDIERDGALGGPNLELYIEAQRRYPALAWQASGGVRSREDLSALSTTGVSAAISGKALIEERITPEDLQTFLPSASSPA